MMRLALWIPADILLGGFLFCMHIEIYIISLLTTSSNAKAGAPRIDAQRFISQTQTFIQACAPQQVQLAVNKCMFERLFLLSNIN